MRDIKRNFGYLHSNGSARLAVGARAGGVGVGGGGAGVDEWKEA